MKKVIKFSILTAIIIISAAGCKKDGNPDDPNNSNDKMEKVELEGMVTDADGNPLSGVRVSSGTESATGADGTFSFTKAQVVNKRAVVRFKKSDYFPLTRSGMKQNAMFIHAVMCRQENSPTSVKATFEAASEKILETPSGLKIKLPGSSVMRADGSDYAGMITANMRYLDPADENFASMTPGGDFLGISKDGKDVLLQSRSALMLTLADAAGKPLFLKKGTRLETTFPVPDGTQSNTLTLSWFNMQKGLWEENSGATKSGGDVDLAPLVPDVLEDLAPLVPEVLEDLAPLVMSVGDLWKEIAFVSGEVRDCEDKPVRALVLVWWVGDFGPPMPIIADKDGKFYYSIITNYPIKVTVDANGSIETKTVTAANHETKKLPTFKVPCVKPDQFMPVSLSYEYVKYDVRDGVNLGVSHHGIVSWQGYDCKKHREDGIDDRDGSRWARVYDHETRIARLGWLDASGESWEVSNDYDDDTNNDWEKIGCSNHDSFLYEYITKYEVGNYQSDEALWCELLKSVANLQWFLQKNPTIIAGKSCKVYTFEPLGLNSKIVSMRLAFWNGVLMREELNETLTGAENLVLHYEVKNITLNPAPAFASTFKSWF